MRTGLGVEDVGDLLEQPLIAVLATRRADDSSRQRVVNGGD